MARLWGLGFGCRVGAARLPRMAQEGALRLGPVRARLASCGNVCSASNTGVVAVQVGDDVGLLGRPAYWTDCLRERGT